MIEEDKIKKAYQEYQLATQGIDIWEEGAFRAGWLASKNFFKPDVIKSVCPDCKGTGDLSGESQNLYEECKRCDGSGQTVLTITG